MANPHVLILRSPGANCDEETAYAFRLAGGVADRIHIQRVRENPKVLHDYQILAIPGGFSYGDDIAAGRILANQLATFLADVLREFRAKENLILGICNGFQALLRAGLLVPPDEDGPLATLAKNDSGRFEDRWVHLQAKAGKCVFLADCDRLYLPVASGEAKFVARQRWILQGLEQSGQVVLRYVDEQGGVALYPDNPNGSEGGVAALCDVSGRVLGIMPHPERHALPLQHPQWTRRGLAEQGDGLQIFRNAVNYFA